MIIRLWRGSSRWCDIGTALNRLRSGAWWEPIRNLLVATPVAAAFWLTANPLDDAGRSAQLSLAATAVAATACSATFPRFGVAVSAGATATAWLLGVTSDPFVVTGVALFTVAEHRGTRMFPRTLVAGILLLCLSSFMVAVDEFDSGIRNALLSSGVLTASWVLGTRTRQARLEASARSRTEERLRLSRDIHDVLAHTLGTIGLRAGATTYVKTLSEDALRQSLKSIENDARSGILELKSILRRERSPGETPDGGEISGDPLPWSLDRAISEIASRLEGAGMKVSFVAPGELNHLPAAIRTTVHRVVQEAATNAARHSCASVVTITVRDLGDTVEAEVADDGVGTTNGIQAGHGLTGMQERVSLLGGDLTITDRDGGGLTVFARLPVPADNTWAMAP